MDAAQDGLDVGQLIDQGAWSAYQKLVLAMAALGFLVDGIANQSLGLAVPSLMADWHLPREAFATVTAIGLGGLTIGTAAGGWLGDRVGRRMVLIASTLFFGLMTMAASRADSVQTLTWIRALAGFGIGAMIPNGAALISEFTPRPKRSLAIAIGMVFIAIGGVLSGLIAAPVLPLYGWRMLFLVLGALPVAVSVLFLLGVPESPPFLARRPERQPTLLRTLRRCGLESPANAQFIDRGRGAPSAAWAQVLFNRDVRGTTLAVWAGFFFCLLASYAMFSWVPAMLASLGLPLSATSLGLTVFSIGGVAGGIVSGGFIQRWGLRSSGIRLAAGGVLAALLLGGLILGDVKNVAALFAALVIEGFFVSGLTNVLYTIPTFIYPHYGRASGVGAAAAAGRIGAIASAYVGLIALRLGGPSGYFVLIALALGASLVAIALINRPIPTAFEPSATPLPAE